MVKEIREVHRVTFKHNPTFHTDCQLTLLTVGATSSNQNVTKKL